LFVQFSERCRHAIRQALGRRYATFSVIAQQTFPVRYDRDITNYPTGW
jgi:hypothetical protein